MNKNLKITLFGIVFILSIQKVFSKTKSNKFSSINSDNQFRNCDTFGCGYFGASRGERDHKGVDFKVNEDEPIKTPFDCEIVRYGFPYSDDQSQKLVEIQGLNSFSDYKAKIMYIKPIHSVGTILYKGSTVCFAGNIKNKYGNSMTNHVHFELYKNGILVNPEPFFE
jgi:hypothetical protein